MIRRLVPARMRDSARAKRFGHRWWVYAAVMVPIAVMPARGWPTAAAVWALTLLGFLWLLSRQVHDDSLCEMCVAEWPTDASAQAAGPRRKWLWWRHNGQLFMLPVSLVFLAGLFLGVVSVAAWMLALAGQILAMDWARRTHDQLEPWCPWCHRDDPPEDETVEPEPDPAESRR